MCLAEKDLGIKEVYICVVFWSKKLRKKLIFKSFKDPPRVLK